MRVECSRAWNSSGYTDYETVLVRKSGTTLYHESRPFAWTGKSRSPLRSGAYIDGWRYPTLHSADITNCRNVSTGTFFTTLSNQLYTRPTGYSTEVAAIGLSNPSIASALADLAQSAGTGALNKLNDTHIEAGVALLEARKTIGHLASTGIRLFSLLRAMRRGRFGEAADLLGLSPKKGTSGLAKNWLEYQYAWRPLISDVSTAYEIVQQGIEVPLTVNGVRDLKSSVTVNLKSWQLVDNDLKYLDLPVQVLAGVKVILHARIKNQALTNLKAFGLANPASIAWELVPWSFVIDWVLPVGEFLNATTALVGLDFVSGSTSEYCHLDSAHVDFGSSGTNIRLEKEYSPASVRVQKFSMKRTPMASPPRPILDWRNRLTTEKVITAAALWRSLSKR